MQPSTIRPPVLTVRERLEQAAADLRQAVIEDRYADSKELLVVYSRVLEENADPEMASKAGELIEWARRLILARRTAFAAQLRQLTGVPGRCYRVPNVSNTAKPHAVDLMG